MLIQYLLVLTIFSFWVHRVFLLRSMPTGTKTFLFHNAVGPIYMNLEWIDDDDERFSQLPEISEEILSVLNQELQLIVSNAALNTVSYYMTEFHDDTTSKWMVEFQDYKNIGFKDDDWNTYITEMIKLDKQELSVYMNPPKKLSKLNSAPDARIRLKYIHEIQPRKVAHQIITVREDISSEIIQDLGSIKVENKEAVKCAQARMLHGKEYADKNRNPTRNSDMGGSTPLRNRNFNTCAVLITNLALDIVRKQLEAAGDTNSRDRLDKVVAEMIAETEALHPAERLVRQTMYGAGPKWLIEQLYYVSITEQTGTAKFINMAQSVLNTRLALALSACKVLAAQNLDARKYFKMIKDCGGFNKLDFGKSKITVVDMDQDIAREAAVAAEIAAKKAAQQQELLEQRQKQEQEQEEELQRLERLRQEETKLEDVDMSEDIDIWSDNFFGPASM